MPSFEEVFEAVLKPPENPPSVTPEQWAAHLRGAQTVARQMGDLVKSGEWETFSAHLHDLRDRDRAQAVALERDMANSEEVGDGLTRQKLQARRLVGRMEVWELVLGLPQLLIDQNAKLQPPAAPVATPPPAPVPPPAPDRAVLARPAPPKKKAKARKR